eukprot:9052997-Pyramimonas_sp.AAC.1
MSSIFEVVANVYGEPVRHQGESRMLEGARPQSLALVQHRKTGVRGAKANATCRKGPRLHL